MIKFDFKGTLCAISFDIKDHFKRCKKLYAFLCLFLLIGLITGLLTGFKFSGEITVDRLNDKVLVGFLSNELGVFPMLMRRILGFCFIFLILFLINIKSFTCFINFLLILYESYVLGLNSAIFINLFSISGIINVFVVYLPCHLILLLALMGLASIFCSSCFYYKRFGESILCSSFWQQNGRIIILMLTISLIACILECILLPTFCSVFFIV